MSSKKPIQVVGIDPKPSGISHTAAFESIELLKKLLPTQQTQGAVAELNHAQLSELITTLTKDESSRWLICWDAPLSIPSGGNNFTIREIERMANAWKRNINAQEPNNRLQGLSTQIFSQCPHWAVTQFMLGLPTVHPNHQPTDNIQYLSTQDAFEEWKEKGKSVGVVEVHPAFALAIWWLERNINNAPIFQKYKGLPANNEHLTILKNISADKWDILNQIDPAGWNDDHLDAYVGLKLGIGLLEGFAAIIDDGEGGSFLLPPAPEDFQFPLPTAQ